MPKVLLIYLVIINIAAFLLYALDKAKAKLRQWRISEACLISAALIGGSVGALLAMYLLRHKTKHPKFTVGVPLILILQIAVYSLLFR